MCLGEVTNNCVAGARKSSGYKIGFGGFFHRAFQVVSNLLILGYLLMTNCINFSHLHFT